MLEDGSLVGNRYRILQRLGKGGMGEVYAAREFSLGRTVALKVLNPQMTGVDGALRRFALEARTIAALSSPHIVQIYEFAPAQNPPYIAMEYVPGGDLAAHIRSHDVPTPRTLADYARQLMSGLRVAHSAGIIHRDIKPANILITDEQVLKITDFGLVRSLHADEGLTNTGSTVGTVEYFPPEVAQGEKPGKYSDVYSAGITLYELFTGRLPFERDESALKMLLRIAQEAPPPPEAFRDDTPDGLREWFRRVLAFRHEQRYADAGEALAGLLELCPELCSGAFVVEPAAPRSDDTIVFPSGNLGGMRAPSRDDDRGAMPSPKRMDGATAGTEAGDGARSYGSDSYDADEQEALAFVAQLKGKGKKGKKKQSVLLRNSNMDSIIGLALQAEREGKETLDEEQLVRLAGEVGIDPEAALEAIESYRTKKKKRKKFARRAKIVLIAVAVAVVPLGVLMFVAVLVGGPVEKLPRSIHISGGNTDVAGGEYHASASVSREGVSASFGDTRVSVAKPVASASNDPIPAPELVVGTEWTNTGLRYDSDKQVVLLRLVTHPDGPNELVQDAGLLVRMNPTEDTQSPKTDRSGHRLAVNGSAMQGAYFSGDGNGFVQLRYDAALNRRINEPANNLALPALPAAPAANGFGGDDTVIAQRADIPVAPTANQISPRQKPLAANAENNRPQTISQRELPQHANERQMASQPPAQRAPGVVEGQMLPGVRVAVADKLRIAALPFAGRAEYADGTGDVLATRLAQTGCFMVVERVQVSRVIDNLKLEQSAYFDQTTTGEIGKLLGVSYLIQGAVQEASGSYRLSAKRVDAQTGTVLESISLQGRDLFALQDQLAQDLFKAIAKTELARLR